MTATPLRIPQVAERLGVCDDTVRMMIDRGELRAVHVGRKNAKRRTLRIMSHELDSFLCSRDGQKDEPPKPPRMSADRKAIRDLAAEMA